jgi:hypothetical protein
MQDQTNFSWRLQLALKITAITCGCVLLLASAKTGNAPLDLAASAQFIADQFRTAPQLKWFFGIIFLSVGIFFVPVRAKTPRSFVGPKDLKNDSYILYLVDKYQIERNTVLNQLTVQNRIFSHRDGAIQFAHELECPSREAPVFSEDLDTSNNEVLTSADPIKTEAVEVISQTLDTSSAFTAAAAAFGRIEADLDGDEKVRLLDRLINQKQHTKLTVVLGVLLFSIALGGLYYANSQNKALLVVPVAPVSQTPESVAAADAASPKADQETVPPAVVVAETQDPSRASINLPINERWIGLWNSENGGKQKLSISPTTIKYGDEEFAWTGLRPKGVITCCPAFYEGSITKADLLARIPGAQDLSVAVKPENQKTLALVNSLSDGNFRKIVLADPFLKKYFFIYDQNFVYRISRDLGDKADLVVEPFKKKE